MQYLRGIEQLLILSSVTAHTRRMFDSKSGAWRRRVVKPDLGMYIRDKTLICAASYKSALPKSNAKWYHVKPNQIAPSSATTAATSSPSDPMVSSDDAPFFFGDPPAPAFAGELPTIHSYTFAVPSATLFHVSWSHVTGANT